jgi:hypothetical protein
MTRPSYWPLGLGILLEFAAVLAILLKVFPKPMKQTDYLVAGTLATFVALGTLFGILLTTTMRDPTAFRRNQPPNKARQPTAKPPEPGHEAKGAD